MIEHIVVGIDPDSERHGVAIFKNKKLVELKQLQLMQIIRQIVEVYAPSEDASLLFSIEDVCANNFVYGRNTQKKTTTSARVGRNIGQCQQSQIELMRALDFHGVEYKKHRPTSGNWARAHHKKHFERVTGWSGSSNVDTRSAAYFGFLEAKK